MGTSQSRGKQMIVNRAQALSMFKLPDAIDILNKHQLCSNALSSFSILDNTEKIKEERKKVQLLIENKELTPQEDRAIGCIVGNAIGDALGAPLEFSNVRYGSDELKGLDHKEIWLKPQYNRFQLKPGQWTDDFSMALCIVDSLLVNQSFNPLDLRLRFENWWMLGYCNAFGFVENEESRSSVGLGGNISLAMQEFLEDPNIPYTLAGDKSTSGNGSVMRQSPVPVYYHNDINTAMDIAFKQSKTTHQGEEAAELCRLLAFLNIKAIERGDGKKEVLEVLNEFTSPLYTVTCLAQSKKEEAHEENKTLKLEDRDWNWKDPNYKFCASRAMSQPGYIGSYAMDAVAMALHCIYTTDNFVDACLKCANMRGDSDSVCAVTASVAGAIYGVTSIPKSWLEVLQQFDRDGDIALKAYKLFHHQHNLE
ncbi:hypothetical protein ABK040_009244 [Willaertia magna]